MKPSPGVLALRRSAVGSAIVEALGRDKKARDGRIPFVLAPEIGSFRLVFDVPGQTVREVLEELAD